MAEENTCKYNIVEIEIPTELRPLVETEFTREEVIRHLLEDMGFSDGKTLKPVDGYSQYPAFIFFDGEVFFVYNDPPNGIVVVGVSIPPEGYEGISMEALERHVAQFWDDYEYDPPPNIIMTVNGVSAKYHCCLHGHRLFLPVDAQDQAEKIRLWCKKHVKKQNDCIIS